MTGFVNPVHILVVAAVALIVVGPKRLPELAAKLGTAWRELRHALDLDTSGTPPAAPPPTARSALEPSELFAPPPSDAPRMSAPDPAVAAIVRGPDEGQESEPGEAGVTAVTVADAAEDPTPPAPQSPPGTGPREP
jgi:TatA/E family protein of Tat protein translocase